MKRFDDHAVPVYGDGGPVMVLGHGIGGHQAHWAPRVEHRIAS